MKNSTGLNIPKKYHARIDEVCREDCDSTRGLAYVIYLSDGWCCGSDIGVHTLIEYSQKDILERLRGTIGGCDCSPECKALLADKKTSEVLQTIATEELTKFKENASYGESTAAHNIENDLLSETERLYQKYATDETNWADHLLKMTVTERYNFALTFLKTV